MFTRHISRAHFALWRYTLMFPRRYAPVSVRVIALLFVSALSSHILSGQVAPVPQNRPHDVHPIAQADQEQFIPYWTTETGWRSELQLRNNMAVGDLAVT